MHVRSFCGHVFCDLCTPSRSLIPVDQILANPERQYLSVNAHNPQRVCGDCFNALLPAQAELRACCVTTVVHLRFEVLVCVCGLD